MRLGILLCALALVAVPAVACKSSGNGNSGGQTDYKERVAELWSSGADDLSPDEQVAALRDQAEAWRKLDPPPELRSAHVAAIEGFDGLAPIAEDVAAGRTPDASTIARARRGIEAFKEFREKFSEFYDVHLFTAEGKSMEPNLCAGDTLTFPRYHAQPLGRWEIIVFHYPGDVERDFMKRVVGLPGETIEVRDEVIRIDGVPVVGDDYALAPPNYVVEPLTIPEDRSTCSATTAATASIRTPGHSVVLRERKRPTRPCQRSSSSACFLRRPKPARTID